MNAMCTATQSKLGLYQTIEKLASRYSYATLPDALRRDALSFWEPGYDYTDPEFWENYPNVTDDFIAAVLTLDYHYSDKAQYNADLNDYYNIEF